MRKKVLMLAAMVSPLTAMEDAQQEDSSFLSHADIYAQLSLYMRPTTPPYYKSILIQAPRYTLSHFKKQAATLDPQDLKFYKNRIANGYIFYILPKDIVTTLSLIFHMLGGSTTLQNACSRICVKELREQEQNLGVMYIKFYAAHNAQSVLNSLYENLKGLVFVSEMTGMRFIYPGFFYTQGSFKEKRIYPTCFQQPDLIHFADNFVEKDPSVNKYHLHIPS